MCWRVVVCFRGLGVGFVLMRGLVCVVRVAAVWYVLYCVALVCRGRVVPCRVVVCCVAQRSVAFCAVQ